MWRCWGSEPSREKPFGAGLKWEEKTATQCVQAKPCLKSLFNSVTSSVRNCVARCAPPVTSTPSALASLSAVFHLNTPFRSHWTHPVTSFPLYLCPHAFLGREFPAHELLCVPTPTQRFSQLPWSFPLNFPRHLLSVAPRMTFIKDCCYSCYLSCHLLPKGQDYSALCIKHFPNTKSHLY